MKKLFSILFVLLTLGSTFAQTPDTLTPEKKARWKVSNRIKDNTIRAITPADFRNTYNDIINIAVKRTPFVSIKELRAGMADTARVVQIIEGLRSGTFLYDPADTTTPDDTSMTIVVSGRRYKRQFDELTFEMFEAKGDYNYVTGTGTNDTKAIQQAINYAARKGYTIRMKDGSKYLVNQLFAYADSVLNPSYPSRPGRLKIIGGASGLATGSLEPQGSALVHVPNEAKPMFTCIGKWSVSSGGNTGGHLDFQNVNFIGGNKTTDVVYLELTVGQVSLKNLTVQVNNPTGNGITENNTWESTMENILIRGQATGTGLWTGIGLNIKTNESGGQVNMKVYNNIDCYKNGYNIRVGRRSASTGTLSPLVFIGGQCSLADKSNMWIDGGTYNLVSIGQQFEGARLNGIRIDSDGANDLPRNLKFVSTYLTGNGKIENDSDSSYAVLIRDGEGVHFDAPLFNTLGNGIMFDAGKCQGLVIERPILRTTRSYGASSGWFINSYGTSDITKRHRLIDPVFNQSTANLVSDQAMTSFLRQEAGGYIGISNNSASPSVTMGGGILQRARFVNFNNGSITSVTNLIDGHQLRTVTFTSSNSNTTLVSNANINLSGGQDFKFTNRSSITLMYTGTYWVELSRSDANGIIYSTRGATLNGSSTDVIIAHNLGVAPSWFSVTNANAAAAGWTYVTADATNIILHYPTAPAAGSASYNMAYKK